MNKRRKVIDCFPFYDEFMLLDVRFREFGDIVDHFVIVESQETFTGLPKGLWLKDTIQDRYPEYVDKITILTPELFETRDPWEREQFQINHVNKEALAFLNLNDDDLLIIGDVDELPRRAVVESLVNSDETRPLTMEYRFYYYKFNLQFDYKWYHPRIVTFGDFTSQHEARHTPTEMAAVDSGWHFSFLKDNKRIQEKLNAFSHQEYGEEVKDLDYIQMCIDSGKSLFDEGKTSKVPIDDTFPEYVKDNKEALMKDGWIV